MVNNDIQKYPSSDSPNHDAFEGIVELYFEVKGYITSSGKWFWKKSEGKQQRGYQDIDVLALKENETVIVSVSSNFDDKLNFSGKAMNVEKSKRILDYFARVTEYLENTNEYKWLVSKSRTTKRVIAFINSPSDLTKYEAFLNKNQIELLNIDTIISEILDYLKNNKSLKIQNQTLRILQILNDRNTKLF